MTFVPGCRGQIGDCIKKAIKLFFAADTLNMEFSIKLPFQRDLRVFKKIVFNHFVFVFQREEWNQFCLELLIVFMHPPNYIHNSHQRQYFNITKLYWKCTKIFRNSDRYQNEIK